MISDAALAQLCAATYNDAPTLPVPYSGVDARLVVADGIAVVAFRGSTTAEDWARDFVAFPISSRDHPQLGPCHAGFLDGAQSILGEVEKAIGAKAFVITGHSLGGALALGTAGLLFCGGRAAAAVVTFGAPYFGMAKFVAAIASLPIRQYRRGNDPVPTVPFSFPPLFDYRDARDPLIAIGQPQEDPFACHNIDGYVADVTAYLTPAKPKAPAPAS